MTESPLLDSGFVVLVFSPRDDPFTCLNKVVAFLTVVASSSKFRGDKVKVILVLGIRVMLLVLGETMQVDKQGLLNAKTVKVKDIWLDPGVTDGQAVQTIIPNNAIFQTEDLDTYDSNYDDISNAKAILMANIPNYRSDVISEGKDPKVIENFYHKPIDYEKLKRLSEDFGKPFTPQQEIDAEQAFWFRISNPTIESSNQPPVKVEVPNELPKADMLILVVILKA
nr:hypothetical protein [Tanacetum cinerariifolium]